MKPSPRARRRLIATAIFFLLFTVVGFFVLPPIVKSQVEQRLSAQLDRKVIIGKIRLNPYALSVTVENFDIRLKVGDGSFLGWDRLYVNFDALSSLLGDWVLSDVELEGFHVGVIILPDGKLNFADLLERLAALQPAGPVKPAKPARALRIGSLKVDQARVEFADQSRPKPFATVLGPVSFAATGLRTAGARGAPSHFEAVTEAGEKLAWTGSSSVEPLRSLGEFELENFVLAKYEPYYAERMQADLVEGKLSVHGRYEVNLTEGQRVLKLTDGALQLRGIKLLERANREAVLELPAFDLTGVNVDALTQKASVGSITLTGGNLHVRRGPDGAINLLNLLPPATAVPAAPPSTAPAKVPDVTIGEIAVKDFQVNVTDLATPSPAQLGLSHLQFSLKNVTLADGAVMPLQLAFNWAPGGTVQVGGSVKLKPELEADLKTEVSLLEIRPLSPYLEQLANARITQGRFSTSNTVHLAMAGGEPAVTFAGGIKMENFGLVDSAHNEDLAGFATLTMEGLNVSTAPQLSVSLTEFGVTGPYVRALVNADKSINLLGVRKPAKPVATAVAAAKPKVEISRVLIDGGDFSFTDRSVEPNVRMGITQFGGSISGLSSENMARATVDLRGMVGGAGPVAISGKLDPLGAVQSVDLKIDFKSVDLVPLSPYTGKYAGYELARGQLVFDAKILIADRKLDSTAVVTLNQFTFGAATNSPDATGLPVRLGVALLKDTDGRIVIDLPVQGSLDDPNFRYGKVVWKVIGNLLAKAATSPFSLLGAMFGGGGEELAFQEFAPGSSELQPAELPKLDTMIKALTNRPGLSLGLEGGYDAVADAYALKRAKFADQVRRQIWETQHATNPNIPPPAQLVIADAEHAAVVKKLFDAKFPPGTQFGTPLPPAPAAVPPPPPPPPGFFQGIWYAITFKQQRAEHAAKEESARLAAEHAKTVAAATATGLPLEEMAGRLAETMVVDDNDLRALAAARAQRVRDRLINEGHISADRLFLSSGSGPAKPSKGPRVFLSLQ